MKWGVFWVLSILLISGCAGYGNNLARTTSLEQVDQIVGADKPVPYKEGFKDGCDSGFGAMGYPTYSFHKDLERFSQDNLYKEGWKDGFKFCKRRGVRSRLYSPWYYRRPWHNFWYPHALRHGC